MLLASHEGNWQEFSYQLGRIFDILTNFDPLVVESVSPVMMEGLDELPDTYTEEVEELNPYEYLLNDDTHRPITDEERLEIIEYFNTVAKEEPKVKT